MSEQPKAILDGTWDLEDVHDNEISPLVSQILEICNRVGMPCYMTFHYGNGADGENSLCSSLLADQRPDDTVLAVKAASVIVNDGPVAALMFAAAYGKVDMSTMVVEVPDEGAVRYVPDDDEPIH